MSHAEREISQKTDGNISYTPFRMPQQPHYNWNATELSVKKTHHKRDNFRVFQRVSRKKDNDAREITVKRFNLIAVAN